MKPYIIIAFIIFNLLKQAVALIPPRFQWKTLDYAWEGNFKCKAQSTGAYIPENNMPSGLARWKDKLFITVPRWKKGVPASLNFVRLNGSQQEPLTPYPNWREAFLADDARQLPSNATVVSALRAHVDSCDRLWVADNGVTDMANENRQIVEPAVVIFDLNKDRLLRRYDLGGDVLRDSSVLSSIVVDIAGKGCDDAYAYITDRGSNALIVYSLKSDEAWRVENHYFHFEPHAGIYKVGGIEFYWNDGVSSAALSGAKSDGHRDLYLHPTSCTKQFKMSTKLLRSKDALQEDIFTGVELVGEKGPDTQASACDYDVKNNVLFYTQLCKNAIGCWNTDKPFTPENNLVLMKDCNVLEFPNDIKIDLEKDPNLWILSNRQSRFLYGNNMDFNQVNFRVLTAPTSVLIRGTPCEKPSALGKVFGCFSAKKNARTNSADSKKNAKGSNTSRTQIESLPCPTDGKVGKEGESCCKSPRNSR